MGAASPRLRADLEARFDGRGNYRLSSRAAFGLILVASVTLWAAVLGLVAEVVR